jgi:peptidyl-prolyl cis-trans isomerase B (cyclophilin B)
MPANRKAEVDAAVKDVDFKKNTYQIELDTTKGKILLDLWGDVAPGHAKNIIGLSKIGFYDGVIFHRVISGFMIQGGCPQGTGTGDAGYKLPQEFNDKAHTTGVLSMARAQHPDSAGSQFFICVADARFLDKQYTAFGKTANDDSTKVALAIGAVKTGAQDRPVEPVKINKATVIEKAK